MLSIYEIGCKCIQKCKKLITNVLMAPVVRMPRGCEGPFVEDFVSVWFIQKGVLRRIPHHSEALPQKIVTTQASFKNPYLRPGKIQTPGCLEAQLILTQYYMNALLWSSLLAEASFPLYSLN